MPEDDVRRLTSVSYLSVFYSAISVTINRHCTGRPDYSCSLLLTNSRSVITSFSIVQKSYIRIGRGFPKYYVGSGTATVKLIFLATRVNLLAHCRVGGRTRRAGHDLVTLDKGLMTEALSAQQATLDQMLNTTSNMTSSPDRPPVNETSPLPPDNTLWIVVGSVAGGVVLLAVIVVIIVIVIMLRRRRSPPVAPGRGAGRVFARKRRFPTYNARFVKPNYHYWSPVRR